MTLTLKRILTSIAVILALLLPSLVFAIPATVSSEGIREGLIDGAGRAGEEDDASGAEDSVNSIITTVINIFSLVVGVISVIMIIIGGLKYITSGGDSGNVTGAKNTILYAVIGLVIVALAQIIVLFVLERIGT